MYTSQAFKAKSDLNPNRELRVTAFKSTEELTRLSGQERTTAQTHLNASAGGATNKTMIP